MSGFLGSGCLGWVFLAGANVNWPGSSSPNCGILRGKYFLEGVYSGFLIVRSSELFLFGGSGLPLSLVLGSGSV